VARYGRVVVVTQWFQLPCAMLTTLCAGVACVAAVWPRFAEFCDACSMLRKGLALQVYAATPVSRNIAALQITPYAGVFGCDS